MDGQTSQQPEKVHSGRQVLLRLIFFMAIVIAIILIYKVLFM